MSPNPSVIAVSSARLQIILEPSHQGMSRIPNLPSVSIMKHRHPKLKQCSKKNPRSPDPGRGALAEQHLLCRRDGAAGLDVEAKVVQDHLQRRQAGDDVELIHVAHVADADDLA